MQAGFDRHNHNHGSPLCEFSADEFDLVNDLANISGDQSNLVDLSGNWTGLGHINFRTTSNLPLGIQDGCI